MDDAARSGNTQGRSCCVAKHEVLDLEGVSCDTILMKASDIIKALEAAGWTADRQSGSHRQFKHPTNPMVVTVPVHGSKDVTVGVLKSIERKAGLKLR